MTRVMNGILRTIDIYRNAEADDSLPDDSTLADERRCARWIIIFRFFPCWFRLGFGPALKFTLVDFGLVFMLGLVRFLCPYDWELPPARQC